MCVRSQPDGDLNKHFMLGCADISAPWIRQGDEFIITCSCAWAKKSEKQHCRKKLMAWQLLAYYIATHAPPHPSTIQAQF